MTFDVSALIIKWPNSVDELSYIFSDSAKEQIIELNMIGELLSFLQDCSDNVAVSILDTLGELIQDG